MSTERDELAGELSGWPIGQGYYGTQIGIDDAQALAATLVDAGWTKPATVTTAEELDALPVGSVVLDEQGEVYKRVSDEDGYRCDGPHNWRSNGCYYAEYELIEMRGSVTVLHRGDR
jgi:hypothetical protein